MAQRRILAAPHPNNPPSMDSRLTDTDHPKPTSSPSNSTRGSDLVGPSNETSSSSIVNHLSRLTLSQKARVSKRPINRSQPQPPPRLLDTRLQGKAMSVSAIVDSSKFSLSKTNPQKAQNNGTATQPVQESSKTKKSVKQIHNKEYCSRRELERQKLQGSGMKLKKDVESVVLVVDRRSVPDCEEDEAAKMEGGLDGKRSSVSSIAVIGGRRRSVCGSQVELRDFLATHGVKVISADMPPFMQIHAVDCARKTYDSMEKFTSKTLALALKKEFDGVYGPAWHCIVGTSFGSFVTHSVGGFMYFSMDHKLYILLFKTTVQRAD